MNADLLDEFGRMLNRVHAAAQSVTEADAAQTSARMSMSLAKASFEREQDALAQLLAAMDPGSGFASRLAKAMRESG